MIYHIHKDNKWFCFNEKKLTHHYFLVIQSDYFSQPQKHIGQRSDE